MFSVFTYIFVLSFLGICSYFMVRKRQATVFFGEIQEGNTSQVECKSVNTKEIQEEEALDPSLVLKEAIVLAIEDGKLSKAEEVMLRETAMQVGKDPDELIQQLREDVFGMEEIENEAIDPDFNPGLTFEKFVFQLLNPRFFRLDHWAGDKFIAKRYTSTDLEPDIQVTANTAEGRFPLAVECKWRAKQDGEYIWFSEDKQLERYQEFAKETGKPTFIVLGLGGQPNGPEDVYLIPIHAFKRGKQHRASLAHYRKPNPEVGFFFDPESGTLM